LDRLNFKEFLEAVGAKLPSISREFVATKGGTDVEGATIDADLPGPQ
jgi:hypothetical protein